MMRNSGQSVVPDIALGHFVIHVEPFVKLVSVMADLELSTQDFAQPWHAFRLVEGESQLYSTNEMEQKIDHCWTWNGPGAPPSRLSVLSPLTSILGT